MVQEPKSGRDVEVAFMPEHIAVRLNDYVVSKNLSPEERIFNVCYTTVRNLVKMLAIGRLPSKKEYLGVLSLTADFE